MSSVLSEIKNTLQSSSIKDTVMDMYQTMITKLNEIKDTISKKDESQIPPTIKEAPAKPKTPKEIVIATLTKVKDIVWEYGLKCIAVFFYIMLASLVANDMIIYAAPIRAFFFLFTLFFTTAIFPCAFFVAFYYLLRRGYDYYNKNLSSAKNKPPQSFPTIFAILPLTTYYPTSPFIRFFLWIFMYQKSDKPERMEKENERLEIIMKKYWDDLNGSFEYIDKIKDTAPFSDLYGSIEKKLTIEGMHPIQKPEKIVELSKTLPDAIGEEKGEKEKEKEGEKVVFSKPQGEEQAKAEKKEEANSTAPNSTATNSTVANSTAPNSKAPNSTVANSKATNSTATNSTVANSTATNSTVANSKAPNSTVANSTAANSKAPNSTATNSTTVAPQPAVAKAPLPPTI